MRMAGNAASIGVRFPPTRVDANATVDGSGAGPGSA
jgi:hypothetical protein